MVSTSQLSKLFTPTTLGGKLNQLTLQHRVVMAPLTRLKHGEEGVPPEITAKYYGQRATKGGLIIAEATSISPQARGYLGTSGIFNQEQIDGWKRVTDTVKAKEGHMFLQLWHTGRVSHPLNQSNRELPVSSSATMDNALAAGFDGVEFHCANGYLLEQFLQDGINDRTDKYGGSIENRARFLFETLDAILEVVDSSRVGIRLSPYGMSFGQFESDPVGMYGYVLKKLNEYHLAYVHLIEPRAFALHENPHAPTDGSMTRTFREIYDGVLMTASGKAVDSGDADMVEKPTWWQWADTSSRTPTSASWWKGGAVRDRLSLISAAFTRQPTVGSSRVAMVKGSSSAYRDMDEEFFASLEEATYECHESPTKKTSSCATLSESTILHKHLERRRATRTKIVVTLSLLLLAGVGSAALYSSVGASAWALKMRGPCPMFRGSSNPDPVVPISAEVFNGDDSPEFGAAVAADETFTEEAEDDLLLDELDPYDAFRRAGHHVEHS
ncbi:unnamed protein product [Phytophthora lilii]|uniref:Unnamed protein product n=1 Tax=Phytophthora lilii TaxID=2077276 RepID=A0A9W6TQQ4_9STRA|nr:unnamed protein product [Phytophthora lilii]